MDEALIRAQVVLEVLWRANYIKGEVANAVVTMRIQSKHSQYPENLDGL